MDRVNLSEYHVKPQLVIVHDPTEFNAFQNFRACDQNDLLAESLFRELPIAAKLHAQHTHFVALLKKRVRVAYLSEILGKSNLSDYEELFVANPNHMFTHDALITVPWISDGYILGRMKKKLRRSEPRLMRKIAELLGLKEIVGIPRHLYLEGGDVIPISLHGRKVFLVGYGPRSAKETLWFLRDTLVRDGVVDEIVGFELAPWRLNVDGCFFPLGDNIAVAQRESIVGGLLLGRDYAEPVDPLLYFEKQGFAILAADKHESYMQQACNFACLGEGSFVAYNMTERINHLLRARGFEIIGVPGDELVKGNGGPHCMTRPIYGTSEAL